MSEPIYQPVPEDAPEIVCPFCGAGHWHHHEHEPGSQTVMECFVCGRKALMNIVGFSSAIRDFDAEELKDK